MIVSEDHIAILKALIHILPQEYYSASVEEALEIAVKLLENSNGLIIEELEKIKEEIQGLIDFEESCCGNTTLGYECLGVINESIEAIRGKNIEKENEDMENNKAGWTEYKDIKDTLVSLLDKGYNKGMIQTVLEQIEEEKEQ